MRGSSDVLRVAFIVAFLGAACGEDLPISAPPRGVLREIREACTELATVWCKSSALCMPETFASSYGDETNCVARQATLCERTRFGEGFSATPEQIVACARASDRGARTVDDHCSEWVQREARRNPRKECATPGTLADNGSCLVGAQCESGLCSARDTCGYCRAPAEDASCQDDHECPATLACAGGICKSFVGLGVACDASERCQPDLACIDGTCRVRLKKGDPCEPPSQPDPLLQPCALWSESEQLACSGGFCAPYVHLTKGQACFGDSAALCDHGLACRSLKYDYNQPWPQPTCVPVLEDGEGCGPAAGLALLWYPLGSMCRAPAICFEGRCEIPHAAACSSPQPP